MALQSPNFVAGVRTYAVDPVTRRELAQKLIADPGYAVALPSAASAAGLVVATLHGDASKVRRSGELVKQAAYDVQRQKWATGAVPNPADRLARAKVVSAQPVLVSADETRRLGDTVAGRSPGELGAVGDPLGPPYTALVSRSLALAALAALGEGSDESTLASLLTESSGAYCLNLAKLNLYQCLSVAKPYYEDVFCLGQHILMDTGQCMTKASGAPSLPAAVAENQPAVGAAASVTMAK